MTEPPPSRRPRLGALRRACLVLASLATGLLLAEGGTRVFLLARGEAWDGRAAARDVEAILQGMTGIAEGVQLEDRAGPEAGDRKPAYELHPYAAYIPPTGLRKIEEAVESFVGPEHESRFDAFLFGGSVAAGFKNAGMERLLAGLVGAPGEGGPPVRFQSFAIPGYKEPQQLMLLTYLFSRGCRPDLVVNLDGLNELRIAQNNADRGLETTYPSVGHWGAVAGVGAGESPAVLDATVDVRSIQRRAGAFGRRALDGRWFRSAIAGRWALSHLRRERAAWASAVKSLETVLAEELLGRRAIERAEPPALDAVLDETIACWFESSLAMHELCAARGARYVHLLQPTLHDEGSKPVSYEEREIGIGEAGLDESVLAGYPRLREGIARLAAAGVEALDTSDAFAGVTETVYLDSCHVGARGNRLIADRALELLGLAPPAGGDEE